MEKAMRSVMVWTCVLWVVGCTTNASEPMQSSGFGGSFVTFGSNSGSAGAPVVTQGANTGSSCPGNNVTQPCACVNSGVTVAGRQTCNVSTGWNVCECAAVMTGAVSGPGAVGPIGNKSSVLFTWNETAPSAGAGTCKAGHYFGAFTGFYNSTAMGAGEMTMSPVGIPLVGTVEFDLHQVGNGEYFELKDGAMEGYALVVFPFKGDIRGQINCAGAEPHIEVELPNGSYLVGDTEYYFSGKAVGIYDKKTDPPGFVSGEWAVTEPEDYSVVVRGVNGGPPDLTKAVYAALPPLVAGESPFLDLFVEGGTGEWNAVWQGPETGVGATADAGP